MFDSPSITLAALAARWDCTPQDIAGARPPKSPPLYFTYEGLVFDEADTWNREGGYDKSERKRHELTQKIAADEEKIRRWTQAGFAEWRKLDERGSDVGSENAASVRADIRNNQKMLEAIEIVWEAREVARSRARFKGYLRATAETIEDIEMYGMASFPRFAIYALSPFQSVALEMPRYPKDTLGPDDLCAMMADVEAIEAEMKKTGSSSTARVPKPAQYVPEPDMTKPDWSLWSYIPELALWQAVALSMDLEPDRHDIGWDDYPDACRTVPTDFYKRLRVAMANLTALGLIQEFPKPSHMLQVSISTFSTWARTIGWSLPDEFLECSLPLNAPANSHIEPRLDEVVHDTLKVGSINIWNEAALRGLLAAANETGITQEKLGERYGVSRQQIAKVLKKAKEQFGKKKASAFDVLSVGSKKK